MNIVCGLPGPPGAWKRAADWLGHTLEEIDPKRPLDALRRGKPEVVLLTAEQMGLPPVSRWMKGYGGRWAMLTRVELPIAGYKADHLVFDREPVSGPSNTIVLLPSLDALPDTPPGTYRPEFACDVAYVGTYHPDLDQYLIPLCRSDLVVKVFGDGPYPVANHLGVVAPKDVADVYASASVSLDLLGEPSRALAVLAAGGSCVTASPYSGTGVERLDATPGSADQNTFQNCVRNQVGLVGKRSSAGVSLGRNSGCATKTHVSDTFTDRLKEILSQLDQGLVQSFPSGR